MLPMGPSELEIKVRRVASGLGVPALEALSSKGLVRRAHKDLERGPAPQVTGGEGDRLLIRVGEFTVSLPETGPTQGRCTCPAGGVCQHLLTAVLFLQQTPAPSASEAPASPTDPDWNEFLKLTAEQLESWSKRASFRTAQGWVFGALPDSLVVSGGTVRFRMLNAEVHCVPGAGLDGVIVSGAVKDRAALVVAAVIALQRSHGIPWEPPAVVDAGLAEASGAPRSRAEVLESTVDLLEETVVHGLAHLSAATPQRFATLAVSALAVNLPRLALRLRGVGEECRWLLTRSAQAQTGRLLIQLAQTHALALALQRGGEHPRPDLVGLHRTQYPPVGHLDLIGVAAWPWQTASGHHGLTVLFREVKADQWCSWSESRPVAASAGFDPVQRYRLPGPWTGAASPAQVAHSRLRLMNARRNGLGRLSASTQSQALVTGEVTPADWESFTLTSWTELIRRLADRRGSGLKEANPLDAWVVIRPTAWLDRQYDPVTQILRWYVGDQDHGRLRLELPFEPLQEAALRHLEKLDPATLAGVRVVGRAEWSAEGLRVRPATLVFPAGPALHLALDTRAASPTTRPSPAAAAEEAEEDLMAEEDVDSASAVGGGSVRVSRWVGEWEDFLVELAEGGVGRGPLPRRSWERWERLRQQAVDADLAGSHWEQPDSQIAPARWLLRQAYVAWLYREEAAHLRGNGLARAA